MSVCVYPGRFCPPTYGHLKIVNKAVEIFGELLIVCSTNKKRKDNCWFTPEECKELWSYFKLPDGVKVITFSELLDMEPLSKDVIMVRGVSCLASVEREKQIVSDNLSEFGIIKYFYMLSRFDAGHISASQVRRLAMNNRRHDLLKSVPPSVGTLILERAEEIRNKSSQ